MAEQQGFEHGFGKRRAVDRNERLVAAARFQVDRARQHFLAGAGRAVDQDGDVGIGDALGQREQRQALGVGGGRRLGAGGISISESRSDRIVGRTEREARGRTARSAPEPAPFAADDQGTVGDRRRLAFHHQEDVARLRPGIALGNRQALRAQRRHQGIFLPHHQVGWKDRTHVFPLRRRETCPEFGKRDVNHPAKAAKNYRAATRNGGDRQRTGNFLPKARQIPAVLRFRRLGPSHYSGERRGSS